MPITFAHPVAVLPFIRTRLLFSAMAIGSMSPDFIYFFNGDPSGHFGHTLAGIFAFCLPISILFYALFHLFLKEPLISLLPKLDQIALEKSIIPQITNLPFVLHLIVSILIGTVTHIVWDSFTHSTGWAVVHWEWLSATIISTQFGTLRVFKIFQYSGHLLGAPVLAVAYCWWISSKLPKSEIWNLIRGWKQSACMAIVFIAVSSLCMFGAIALLSHEPMSSRIVGKLAVYEINFIVIALISYGILYHIRSALRKR